jgi:hypothetical protein
MRWWEKQESAEEATLVAWASLINDPFITVYTMKLNRHGDWVEDRHYVNPKLAFNRMMIGVGNSMMAVRDQMQEKLIPAFADVGEAFQKFADNFNNSGLKSLRTDEDRVD